MRILKKGYNNKKHLDYTALVRPIMEYGAVCFHPYGKVQVSDLKRKKKKKAAKFADNINELGWETLVQRRMIAGICALPKAYTGRRVWKAIWDRLLKPCYLSRDNHNRIFKTRKQRPDVGKHSFVNRTIKSWNQ
jgi:hypothetical protein